MTTPHDHAPGAQRLPLDALHRWEALGFGMFLTFGMSTYDGLEMSPGDTPIHAYHPDRLDVDQWVSVARDAGMTYAVLTAKHVSGFCLWPSQHTDYHVGNAPVTTDVVAAFVKACERRGIRPGLYYCSWDNHHRFGSDTPSDVAFDRAFTTAAYRDFQLRQVEELLTQYGPLVEAWIDIPGVLGPDGRRNQYDQIARLQPHCPIMMNHGCTDGTHVRYHYAWPTDLMAIERFLPSSARGYQPWHAVGGRQRLVHGPASRHTHETLPDPYFYLPAEVCDTIGYEWFHQDQDPPRSPLELLAMRLICQARRANLLLNVPPDRSGRLPDRFVHSLAQLTHNQRQIAASAPPSAG